MITNINIIMFHTVKCISECQSLFNLQILANEYIFAS